MQVRGYFLTPKKANFYRTSTGAPAVRRRTLASVTVQPADERAGVDPTIVEFDDEGTATLHLPAASRRRFMVDESPEGTFCLVPLVNDEELPAELRDRMAANEADPGRLVRHPRHRG